MPGNGWCTHPPELDCAFESICESCTFFQTSIEFRPPCKPSTTPSPATRTTAGSCSPCCSPALTRTSHESPAASPGRPGQLPAPATGQDSLQVLDEAIDQLARLRTPYWLGDSAVRLHALASPITQAQQLLPQAVRDTRDQELTWAQIGELLGTTATASRRYRNKP